MTEKIGTVNSDCEDGPQKVHQAAVELYQLAALMLGDESQAADLVEATVAQTTIDPCADSAASVEAARVNLVQTAVARLSQADPAAFRAPALAGHSAGGCIDDDELDSAGVSRGQLSEMLSGPGRRDLRDWLEKLPVASRAIFVERAILGWDNTAAAASLSKASPGWQPEQVSQLFRQALCSLASSLLHSASARA
jgi:DNA-directed RNA polymerase specialized sigma24 family protein